MATYGLIAGYRRFTKIGSYGSTARVGYWCQESATAALTAQLYGNIYLPSPGGPTGSGLSMRCSKVAVQHSALGKNSALVLAYYEHPRDAFYARVSIHGLGSDMREMLYDINGTIISGRDADGIHEWKVIDGTNKIPVPQTIIKVEWAAYTVDGDEIINQIGCVNNKKLLGCEPGTLLLLGAPWTKLYKKWELYYIDYYLAYSGDPNLGFWKWNEKIVTQKGLRIARQVPVYDTDGAAVLDSNSNAVTSRISDFMFIDNAGNATESRVAPMFPVSNFDHMPNLRW